MSGPRTFADPQDRAAVNALQVIPGVGPATAGDLVALGIRSLADLKRQSPQKLYARIQEFDGAPHDICVLDSFASAIHFAKTGEHIPWWDYSRARKAGSRLPQANR